MKFFYSDRMIAAGFDNGDIKLFDLKNMKIQWSTNVLNGVCGLQFDRLGNIENYECNECYYVLMFTIRHRNEQTGGDMS